MATRRVLTGVSALALCLTACSPAGTAVRSTGGTSAAAPVTPVPHHRTVVLDPSTGNEVVPGTPSAPEIVILNPVTGRIVRRIR